MVVQPVGIVVGAGELARGLALPAGQAVRVARGETLRFVFALLNSDGTPWGPVAGTAEVRVFDAYTGATPRLTVPLSRNRDNGYWEGTVSAAVTARWQPGVQLYWSTWTADGEDVNQAVPLSLLTVIK